MPEYTQIIIERNVAVPMRDGTTLYADVYRPAQAGKYPVCLQRTPYLKGRPEGPLTWLDPTRAVAEGFVLVIQDTRGRGESEGEFYTFVNEIADGYDTVEWCAVQPWSNGNIGMYGGSYVGATQWLAAISQTTHLKAIFPCVTPSDYRDGWTHLGGAFCLGFNMSWALGPLGLTNAARMNLQGEERETYREAVHRMRSESMWHLPLAEYPHLRRTGPYFYDWLAHPSDDEYWQRWNIENRHGALDVAAWNLGGWYDLFLAGTLRNYTGMRANAATEEARRAQRLIIGPWVHQQPMLNFAGEADFGVSAFSRDLDLDGLHLRWFRQWLGGEDTGVLEEPPVRLFVMGENRWRDEDDWPLARAENTPYYLHGGGRANSLRGDGTLSAAGPGEEPADAFTYDPANPVVSSGGGLCCWNAALPPGVFDQRPVESRADVLVYTSAPLERDLEVTGPVKVYLWAASDAPDTDFTAKLVDVGPCGYARNLTDGIIRARYRESASKPTPITPGQIYRYEIDLAGTSNVFKAGHRIRVEISSSNFPRFDRNPNTGAEPGTSAELRPARQTVFHDAARPSHIVLPIVPR